MSTSLEILERELDTHPNLSPWIAKLFVSIHYRNRGPILIIDEDEDYYTIVELTTDKLKNPPSYFDNCKQLIVDWNKAELDDESYVKCHSGNIDRVEETRLFERINLRIFYN